MQARQAPGLPGVDANSWDFSLNGIQSTQAAMQRHPKTLEAIG